MARKNKRSKWDGVDRRAPAKVLVVSDDEGARELLVRVVGRAGYETWGESGIEEAVADVHERLPRCIVLDMRSGGIGTNLKILDLVRSSDDERISSARAVIIADNPRNRAFSFQSGTDAFVIRPYRADDLVAQIADVLSRPDADRARHRRDELVRHGELPPDAVGGARAVSSLE